MNDERAIQATSAERSLIGHWQRLGGEPCVDAYPERIEMRSDGVYLAESDDDRFREWQAGDYEIRGKEIRMQMSNDAMAPFGFALPGRDRLVFTDGGGCEVEYRRLR